MKKVIKLDSKDWEDSQELEASIQSYIRMELNKHNNDTFTNITTSDII